VDDIEVAYEDLQKKGARFIAPPSPVHMNGNGFRFAYLLDPDDVSVEILQHQRNT
jgi:catechol 2,3-dioxygenase-like lactoylglutathione lyase family enzyme